MTEKRIYAPKVPWTEITYGALIVAACLLAYAFMVNYEVKIIKLGAPLCKPEKVRQLGPGLQWPWQ